MRTIRMGTVGYAAAVAALSVFSLQAQSVQASLAKETGALSDKFGGLARVMAGKYAWKPGEGVRSGERRIQPDRGGERTARQNADGRSRRRPAGANYRCGGAAR